MIECINIAKTYMSGQVETPVLKGVSLTICDGEFVAIMGPSGSGKSTLMNILGLLDTPTSGTYLLDGQDVSKLSEDQLAEIRSKKMGFVFQSFNLLKKATVLTNVRLPLIYNETPEEKRDDDVRRALVAAGMPENRWHALSNELSGGQMQRVAIARALVNNPSIIFADEPTGNLDSKTGDIVLHTFTELNRRDHRTIVLITHEQYVAEHADRIIRIQDGTVIEDRKAAKFTRTYTPNTNGHVSEPSGRRSAIGEKIAAI
jgi:putative ABC transport system ATP-binding protein